MKRADNELLKKEVIGITESGETRTLAKLVGTKWSLIDSSWSVRILTSVDIGVPFFELTGHRTVRLTWFFHASQLKKHILCLIAQLYELILFIIFIKRLFGNLAYL